MPVRLADALVYVGADDRDLDRALNESRGKVSLWGNTIQGILQGVGQQLFRTVAGFIGRAFDEVAVSGIRLNSSLENVEARLLAFTKDGAQAAEILEMIRKRAAETPFAFQEMAEATASLLPAAKQSGAALTELIELAEILAASNPAEGLEGAAFALREALSGDFTSIIERFNLSRSTLNALKEQGVPALEAVSQAMREMGLDASLIDNMAQTLTGRWSTFTDTIDMLRQRLSAPIFDVLKAGLTVLQGLLESNLPRAEAFADAMGSKLANGMVAGANAVARGVELIAGSVGVLGDIAVYAGNWGANVLLSFADGMLAVLPVLTSALSVVADLFTWWLEPGSPPRLLPDLTRWGTGAAQAYLEGWEKADFTTLETIAGSIERVLRSLVGTGDLGRGDLFGAITGARDAVAAAVREFATAGSVSEAAFRRIRESSGSAGEAIERMARSYFNLREATEAQRRAQEALQNVQDRYSEALAPISSELRDVQNRRQEIRDAQRLAELNRIINDPFAGAQARELARLEAREIDLRQRQRELEAERDQELANAQAQLDAANSAVALAETELSFAQAVLDQQLKTNALIAEEVALQQSLAEARKRAADAASTRAERERAKAVREIQQAIREQIRETERIADAQLRYRLQVADTAGKLAIMREELGKVQEGSAEYYAILTQIDQLEKQLAKEREKAGKGGGIFPESVTDIASIQDEVTSRVQDIETKLSEAMTRIQTAAGEAAAAWEDARTRLEPVIERWDDLTASLGRVQSFAQGNLIPVLDKLFGFYMGYWGARLSFLTGAWNLLIGASTELWTFVNDKIIPIFQEAGRQMDPTFSEAIRKVSNALFGPGSLGEAFGQVFALIRLYVFPALKELFGNAGIAAFTVALQGFVTLWNGLWDSLDRVWRKWNEVKQSFSISPPWANWSWPSFLQQHSPSPAEQSLRDLTAAMQELSRASSALQLPAAASGDTYSILISQSFAPNADVGLARQAVRQGLDESVLMASRRKGRR